MRKIRCTTSKPFPRPGALPRVSPAPGDGGLGALGEGQRFDQCGTLHGRPMFVILILAGEPCTLARKYVEHLHPDWQLISWGKLQYNKEIPEEVGQSVIKCSLCSNIFPGN